MQAVDVRMQASPLNEAEKNESLRDTKKADAEPVRNGDSFLAMIKKMIAAAKDGSKEIDESKFKDSQLREKQLKDSSLQKETGMQKNSEFMSEEELNSENMLNSKDAYLKSLKLPAKKTKAEAIHVAIKEQKAFAEKLKKSGEDSKLRILNSDFPEEIKKLLPQDLKDDEKLLLFRDADLKQSGKVAKKKTLLIDDEKFAEAGKLSLLSKMDKKDSSKKTSSQTEIGGEISSKKHLPKSRPRISVEDLRTIPETQVSSVHTTGSETRVETDNSVDMIIDCSGKFQNLSGGGDLQNTQSGSEMQKTPQSFSAMLSQEIRDAAADFVQAGKIVLRDNNAGEIRLQLRPENLGAVKIHLELTEGKRISGTVSVATKEAYEAFEKNLDNLAQEFKQNGFEFAEFNLNWSGFSHQEDFNKNFDFFDEFVNKNKEQDLRLLEKSTDNLSTYSYAYGSTVDILA